MLGAILSGIGTAAKLIMGNKANKQAQKNYETQIQTRVADANAAGIHPLYALGANTQSYAPNNIGESLADDLGNMGQNIDRARMATSEAGPRGVIAKLALDRAGLENDLLRARIASEIRRTSPPHVGPAMPSVGGDLYMGGQRIQRDPTTSDSQDFENRYGEPAEWIASPGIAWNDLKHNVRNMSFGDMLRWVDDRTKFWGNTPHYRSGYGKTNRERR